MRHRAVTFLVVIGVVAGVLLAPSLGMAEYIQTNLVSDIPGLAQHTDPNLKNPWGISSSSTSPFWVSNQVTGVATLYNGSGVPQALVVTIPGGNPTGQVFNSTASDFALASGGRALFLFSTLGGSITGWNGAQGTNAVTVVAPSPGAVYTGLALGANASGNFLYAANGGGTIDVFDSTFGTATLAGSFTDPNLPAGFTPYNIQNIGGVLFVTYENEDTGGGVVNAFDTDGNFLRRVSSNGDGGPLASPWGLALAPASFGPFGGALLIGNEDDGVINAFNPTTGQLLGHLSDANGDPIANTGLWGLRFGNGGNGGDPGVLFFAAGINEEVNGLFGSIAFQQVSVPSTLVLLGAGALVLVVWSRRRG